MGYDLPAAIGVAFAKGRRAICIAGDGSLQINVQELQTVVRHNLPLKYSFSIMAVIFRYVKPRRASSEAVR